MSFQAMAAVIPLRLPHNEKSVLLMLANYANEDNKCWPSIERLAADTGMSESSVRRAIHCLRDYCGIVAVQQRAGDDGRQTSNNYVIDIDLCRRLSANGDLRGVRLTGRGVSVTGGEGVRLTGGEGVRVTPEPIRDEPIRDEPIERERAKSGVEQRNAVNTDHEALAAALGLDVKNEWLKYNDWKASTGRFHKDPAAGFRNWLRKAAEFKTKTTPSTGKPRQSREDLVAAVCGARSSVLTSTAQVIDITEGESHAVAKRMG